MARGALVPLALCLMTLPGCGTVVDAVAAVFGPGGVGEEVDAHVVYRLRTDCPYLLARSISNGYTVLRPIDAPPIDGLPTFVGADVEETGVFEGPVRTGEVVFRYVAPAASETWDAGPVDALAEVDGVNLTLADGSDRMVALCGPEPVPLTPDPTVPRFPDSTQ